MKVNVTEREVMDPLADFGGEKIDLNEIPSEISKISLFNNTKPNADVILETIESQLVGMHQGLEIIHSQKPAGAGATPQELQKAAQGDVSILALGDCGSCTTWVILDAIRLEKEGVPTISICSHKFAPFARTLAQSHGAESLRILEVEHPIAGRKRDEVVEKTLKIFPNIKEILNIS
ncbi:MAG: UGSC family (seleno)protein [Methanobacteriaceae archaeon]|nr:UGSC family (seleno)protein [Methanobacteriaceae archaeon]MDP2836619.1 UGSC family (seleno)protein [Methanobacteriaceae archaeon]MDP3034883.1 UGSC family (seleno)protein [Methanobacteriaceae archaeon]MDP3485507.1 UGSC family (seleno)protein [Methanobacteriaceae archaeon]MDP3622316.1 UGSC family (seleno)protein [Methanobacteriaceae archaeon]